MTDRKIYTLTEKQLQVLGVAIDAADDIGALYTSERAILDAALIPIDQDAAVDRMVDAMIAVSPDRNDITESEREWYERDARAALDALLQDD